MARMRLINAETLAQSLAQARDAENYAVEAARADKAAVEREETRRKQVREEKARRVGEQERVDLERERARRLKLARLGVGREGAGEVAGVGKKKEREDEEEVEVAGGEGWNGNTGGRRAEERANWSDRRGSGRPRGNDVGGRGNGNGRGGRGGRSSDVGPRDQVKKGTNEIKSKVEATEVKKPSGTLSEGVEGSKEAGTSWADSPAGEQ